jgi:hypothetical protein
MAKRAAAELQTANPLDPPTDLESEIGPPESPEVVDIPLVPLDGIEVTVAEVADDDQDWGDIIANAAACSPVLLAAATLAGDMRDGILEMMRDLREPFHKIGEKHQGYFATRAYDLSMTIVGQMVGIIAAHDFPSIAASIKTTKIKDSIEAVLVVSKHDEYRHQLLDMTGAEVTLVLVDSRQFMGARGAPLIDKDEPELPIDKGDGPLFAETNPDAHAVGRANGLCGHQDNAARWTAGSAGRAAYDAGHAEGSEERRLNLIAARREGAVAARNEESDGSENPYPLGSAERDEWAGGWLNPAAVEAESAQVVDAPMPLAETEEAALA